MNGGGGGGGNGDWVRFQFSGSLDQIVGLFSDEFADVSKSIATSASSVAADVPPEGQGALYGNVRKIIQNVAHLRQIVDGAKRGDFHLPVEMLYAATLLKVPKGCCAACLYPVACCLVTDFSDLGPAACCLVTDFCDLGRPAYCLLSVY